MLLSLVVPVFQEEENLPHFLARLRPTLAGITEDYEIIFASGVAIIAETRRRRERRNHP